jgi:hypothetical protein
MSLDFTLTMDSRGRAVLHRPDCAIVEITRAAGLPLMTMLGCERDPPSDIRRCECLARAPRHAAK